MDKEKKKFPAWNLAFPPIVAQRRVYNTNLKYKSLSKEHNQKDKKSTKLTKENGGRYLRQSSNHTRTQKKLFNYKIRLLNTIKSPHVSFTPKIPHNRCGLTWQWNHPFRHSKSSNLDFGITQTIPQQCKNKWPNIYCKEQWSGKWWIDSPLLLHIQHQSTINKCLL